MIVGILSMSVNDQDEGGVDDDVSYGNDGEYVVAVNTEATKNPFSLDQHHDNVYLNHKHNFNSSTTHEWLHSSRLYTQCSNDLRNIPIPPGLPNSDSVVKSTANMNNPHSERRLKSTTTMFASTMRVKTNFISTNMTETANTTTEPTSQSSADVSRLVGETFEDEDDDNNIVDIDEDIDNKYVDIEIVISIGFFLTVTSITPAILIITM